jgi:hypothetical protein
MRHIISWLVIAIVPTEVWGVTVALDNLSLVAPSDPVNVLTISLDAGLFGSDVEQSVLTGSMAAQLELDVSSGDAVPVGITFTQGTVHASDAEFHFLRGTVPVSLMNIAGEPSTPIPPGEVLNGMFPAEQHAVTINQGTVEALGNVIDLSTDPVSAAGSGFGAITLTQVSPAVGDELTYDVYVSLPVLAQDMFSIQNVPLFGTINVDVAITGIVVATERINVSFPSPSALQAGDANQDLSFDQRDIVAVSIAGKYLTGQASTWGEGDWNGAPEGRVGSPPDGDGVFNQLDIVAAQQNALYLTGPYGALSPEGRRADGQTSIIYRAATGEIVVDAPAGNELTSINIDSAAGIFTGDPAVHLGGSFDHDADDNIFKATFGSSFGSLSFGAVARPGLEDDFLLGDLTVIGSFRGGGALGDVDLIYVAVPEPAGVMLVIVGGMLLARRITRKRSLPPFCVR